MAQDLPGIKNITVSGRIGSGATTLAKKLSEHLGWEMLDGGKIFRKLSEEKDMDINKTNERPDKFDLEYEDKITRMLKNEEKNIIQSHLAGYDARGIPGVFKILVITEDGSGEDKMDIRIDRLMNRDGSSVEDAKVAVKQREDQHLMKFRRLYADNDPNWVYWDKKYYDLVINTYKLNQEDAFTTTLSEIKKITGHQE